MKKLLFLIPFYIFTYESRFKEIDGDADKVAELTKEYANIAASYENIRKGVGSVMSGQVLDYEAKRIRNESILDTLISLVKKGLLSVKDAADQAGITETAFQQKMAAK